MAYAVMIKFALKFEEQKAMLVWANLNLFVRGLEIEAGADEGAVCVLAVRGKAQIRGHREADLFWQVAPRVHVAHSAVQNKAWLLIVRKDYVKFSHGHSLWPACPSFGFGAVRAGYPSAGDLFFQESFSNFGRISKGSAVLSGFTLRGH